MSVWTIDRKSCAQRERRIIMNNDGDDTFLCAEPTVESFLAERCHGLESSQVDTLFYSTTVSFNLHSHDSRVAELFQKTDSILLPRTTRKISSNKAVIISASL